MENPNNVKRTLRVRKEINEEIKKRSEELGISANDLIVRVMIDYLKK